MPEIACIDRDTVDRIIDDLAEQWPDLRDLGARAETPGFRGPVLVDLADNTFGIVSASDAWDDQTLGRWIADQTPALVGCTVATAVDYADAGSSATFYRLYPTHTRAA